MVLSNRKHIVHLVKCQPATKEKKRKKKKKKEKNPKHPTSPASDLQGAVPSFVLGQDVLALAQLFPQVGHLLAQG